MGLDQNPYAKLVVRIIAYSAIGLFFLVFNPFGIGDKTDQATQDALYKIAAPYYKSSAQQDIVVVLINQHSIDELYTRKAIQANEWPVRYRDHAYLLSRILKYQPRSVFVDIYFKKERSTDDSFKQFTRMTGRMSEKYGAPLLFAGGYHDEEYTDIQRQLAEVGELVITGWQEYGRAYPLIDEDGMTAAYRMYQLACLDDEALDSCNNDAPLKTSTVESGDAVSVRWGSRPGSVVFPEFSRKVCTDRSGSLFEVGRQLVMGIATDLVSYDDIDESVDAQCAYHPVIYADELVYVDKVGDEDQKQRLKSALKDKMVMYGLSLEGLHDNVDTPVHGLLPGVFFHAMTLDNLMHYGSDYVHATDEGIEQINQYIWLGMTLVFSLLLFHYDRKQYNFTGGCDRWVNYENTGEDISAFRLFWLASLTIITISIGMFLFVRYEPFNSIGFLVLIGVSSGLVSSNFAERIIRFLTFSWVKDLMPWLTGLPSRLASNATEDKEKFGPEAANEFYQRTFELMMDDGWIKACNYDSDISPQVYIDPESGACAPIPDLSIEVGDIDTVWSRIKSSGYEIRYGLSTEPCGIRRFCFCDPQQKLVNVFQRGDDH